jgi:hypothetical protein
MADISNWNKALWTPDVIYYNFSGDWNVLFKFHYFTIHGDIFIHIHFNFPSSTPSFPKSFLPSSFSSILTCSRNYSLRHSFKHKPEEFTASSILINLDIHTALYLRRFKSSKTPVLEAQILKPWLCLETYKI